MIIPYFDPPAVQLNWTMDASKAVAGIQNCASQLALRDGDSAVTPVHVFAAMKILLAAAENMNTIPSGILVNQAYKPLSSRCTNVALREWTRLR